MNVYQERIKLEFDEIARLSIEHDHDDKYDEFLLRLVPPTGSVLEIGCGLGRFTKNLATSSRRVIGIDLSTEMIDRASSFEDDRLKFRCGDFLSMEFDGWEFDSVISVATLHHLPLQTAVNRMSELVRPGGTLIIHDLRSESTLWEHFSSFVAGITNCFRRFFRTGRFFAKPALREAWLKHGATEAYLTMEQVRKLADSFSPAARVYKHWFWRYTLIWRKPRELQGGSYE